MKAIVSSQLLVWGWLMSGSLSFAQPVLESYERFELNWSAMRVRFFGESQVGGGESGFDVAEKIAIDDGLKYALGQVGKMRQKVGVGSEEDDQTSQVAHELTKQAYVVNTSYYADGRVRVDLEGQMSKVFETNASKGGFKLGDPTSEPTEATAVVLEIKSATSPQLVPEIVSSTGETLYSVGNVARSSFRKNMLGRWFYQNSVELKNFRGKSPLVLEAELGPEGRVTVSKEQWKQLESEHPRLFEDAKIAFVISAPNKGHSKL